jgi:hypothetical protein
MWWYQSCRRVSVVMVVVMFIVVEIKVVSLV